MNLKKTLTSVLAATVILGSMLMPAYADSSTQSTTSQSSTNIGELHVSFWYASYGFTFAPSEISTLQSQVVADSYTSRPIMVSDVHSYNPDGYTIQISATNLVTSDTDANNEPYFIDKKNLRVSHTGGGPHSSCLQNGFDLSPVGGNTYQTVDFSHIPVGNTVTLESTQTLITGSSGRGCGGNVGAGFQRNYEYSLNVPAGTYTGEGTAVYTGSITYTVIEGEPAEPGN